MKSAEITCGRKFGVTLENGEDFLASLMAFCQDNDIKQAYIPHIVGGFSNLQIIGTCEKLSDPKAPSFNTVYLEYAEVVGSGSLAFDVKKGILVPHIHLSAGLRPLSSVAYTGHLISGTVQFLAELLIIEITDPEIQRTATGEGYTILDYLY